MVHAISSGSYGTVYSYASESPLPPNWIIKASRKNRYYYNTVTNKDTTIRPRIPGDNYIAVAVKVFKDPNDDEIKIIRQLNGITDYKCDTVRSRIIGLSGWGWSSREFPVVLMEIMDGDLGNLLKKEEYHDREGGKNKLKIHYIIPIMLQLATILKCLLDLNYIYEDLKAENILFKRDNEGRIHIVLGDLGSICKRGDSNACTWNPWEYRNELGFPKCNESTMVWCLGIVICELLDVSTDMFHWSEISKKDKEDIERQIDMISLYKGLHKVYVDKKKKKTCEKLLKDMLNLDPKKRISLNTIIQSIQ